MMVCSGISSPQAHYQDTLIKHVVHANTKVMCDICEWQIWGEGSTVLSRITARAFISFK